MLRMNVKFRETRGGGPPNSGLSRRNGGMPHFGRNDYATESERLKTGGKRGDYRKFYCIGYP